MSAHPTPDAPRLVAPGQLPPHDSYEEQHPQSYRDVLNALTLALTAVAVRGGQSDDPVILDQWRVLEAQYEKGRKLGYASGYKEGESRGHAAGYDEGYAAAMAEKIVGSFAHRR